LVLQNRKEIQNVARELQRLGPTILQAILEGQVQLVTYPHYAQFPVQLEHLTLKFRFIRDNDVKMLAATLPSLKTLRIMVPVDTDYTLKITPECLSALADGCRGLQGLQLPLHFGHVDWLPNPFPLVD